MAHNLSTPSVWSQFPNALNSHLSLHPRCTMIFKRQKRWRDISERKKTRRLERIKSWLLSLRFKITFLVFVCLSFVYSIFFSSLFEVRELQVLSDAEELGSPELQSHIRKEVLGRSLFSLGYGDLETQLTDTFPELKKI